METKTTKTEGGRSNVDDWLSFNPFSAPTEREVFMKKVTRDKNTPNPVSKAWILDTIIFHSLSIVHDKKPALCHYTLTTSSVYYE
jgi:hypothetical protein